MKNTNQNSQNTNFVILSDKFWDLLMVCCGMFKMI